VLILIRVIQTYFGAKLNWRSSDIIIHISDPNLQSSDILSDGLVNDILRPALLIFLPSSLGNMLWFNFNLYRRRTRHVAAQWNVRIGLLYSIYSRLLIIFSWWMYNIHAVHRLVENAPVYMFIWLFCYIVSAKFNIILKTWCDNILDQWAWSDAIGHKRE
jgi:hypothetical protein